MSHQFYTFFRLPAESGNGHFGSAADIRRRVSGMKKGFKDGPCPRVDLPLCGRKTIENTCRRRHLPDHPIRLRHRNRIHSLNERNEKDKFSVSLYERRFTQREAQSSRKAQYKPWNEIQNTQHNIYPVIYKYVIISFWFTLRWRPLHRNRQLFDPFFVLSALTANSTRKTQCYHIQKPTTNIYKQTASR